MVNSTNISIRMNTEVRTQAEALFSELGMNMTTAINVFLRQAIRERRIPFDVALLNVDVSRENSKNED